MTWIRKPGYAILASAGKEVMGVNTSVECRRLCLKETSFLCRSAQWLRGARLCVLSTKTSKTAGNDFVRWPGCVFEEWSCGSGNKYSNIFIEYIYSNKYIFVLL